MLRRQQHGLINAPAEKVKEVIGQPSSKSRAATC
jgi:hypothetical protein